VWLPDPLGGGGRFRVSDNKTDVAVSGEDVAWDQVTDATAALYSVFSISVIIHICTVKFEIKGTMEN
jgi:hypothetical protein